MDTLRHFALGCCLLCSAAGMVRLFWPENSFKPVINSVLVLYIITAGLTMLRGTNWQSIAAQVRGFSAGAGSVTQYDSYRDELALAVSLDAVREVLSNSGIDATVAWQGETCLVRLTHAGDLAAAQSLLQQNLGALPYEIVTGGAQP